MTGRGTRPCSLLGHHWDLRGAGSFCLRSPCGLHWHLGGSDLITARQWSKFWLFTRPSDTTLAGVAKGASLVLEGLEVQAPHIVSIDTMERGRSLLLASRDETLSYLLVPLWHQPFGVGCWDTLLWYLLSGSLGFLTFADGGRDGATIVLCGIWME